jgi:hypothetical protein
MSIKIKQITAKNRVSKFDIVRCQVILEFVFIRKEQLTNFDIDLLTLIAIWEDISLSTFCVNATKFLHKIVKAEEFTNKSQNIRNRLNKLQKKSLIEKVGNKLYITNKVKIQIENNLMLTYNFLNIEAIKA